MSTPNPQLSQVEADIAKLQSEREALLKSGVTPSVIVQDAKSVIQTARDGYALIETWLVRLGTGAFTALAANGTGVHQHWYTVLAGGVAFSVNEIENYLKSHAKTTP